MTRARARRRKWTSGLPMAEPTRNGNYCRSKIIARIIGADGFSDQPGRDQRPQNLLDELARDADLGGHLLQRGRVVAALETLADEGHQSQGDKFLRPLVDAFEEFFLQIRGPVLKRISDLRA